MQRHASTRKVRDPESDRYDRYHRYHRYQSAIQPLPCPGQKLRNADAERTVKFGQALVEPARS